MSRACPRIASRSGFTLVELLVVIAIIGILVALLLPAIQSAREAGRRNTCMNHLKQIALAAQNHNDSMKSLPTAGWGYVWIGDPDRGFGPEQPGGWLYNLLPFLEEKNLHDLGKGLPPQSAAKKAAAAMMLQTPLDVFNCPTRRPLQTYDTKSNLPHFRTPNYSNEVLYVARTDYAGNGGSVYNNPPDAGPSSHADAVSATWTNNFKNSMQKGNGVFAGGSVVRLKLITDGLSRTFFCGEKKINPDNYTNGLSANDNETLYMGFNGDIMSWANLSNQYLPEADRAGNGDSGQFGSAHTSVFQMAFCDGSVQRIPYETDPNIIMFLANRRDGNTVNTGFFQ